MILSPKKPDTQPWKTKLKLEIGCRKIAACILIFSLMIFSVLYKVFLANVNNVEQFASIGYPTYTSTTTKKFLYLIIGEDCLPVHFRSERSIGNGTSCNCDIIMFGYKEKCDEAKDGNFEHVEHIHRKGTSWNTARNLLYEYAMKRKTVYLYYIFMDDDVTLRSNADTNVNVSSLGLWRSFENFLVQYQPAVGITMYCRSEYQVCEKQRNKPAGDGVFILSGNIFDACFNGFHHDALPYLLPYILKNEKESWWYSQYYVAMLAKYYFSGSVLIYGNVNIVNVAHRNYPRTSGAKLLNEQNLVIAKHVDLMTKSRKKPKWKNRINVSETSDRHDICKC